MATPAIVKEVVVIAVNGSSIADAALEWYVDKLHRPDNKVIMTFAPNHTHNFVDAGEALARKMHRELLAEHSEIEKKYLDKAKDLGIQAEFTLALGGKHGEAIVDVISEEHATYVVTATRGLKKVKRALKGSVSDYLVHHSPVPVVVCRLK